MATNYSIVGVIQKLDNQLYGYDTTYKTYTDALITTEDRLFMIVVFEISNENETLHKFVDMNRLLAKYLSTPEYVDYHVQNWNELTVFLAALYNFTDSQHRRSEILNQYCTHSPVPKYQWYIHNGLESARMTPFASNLKDTINVVSLGYTNQLDATYVNKDFPKIRGISHRRIDLPDLVFTKTDSDFDLDLKNTIPSVDGVICYPIFSNDTQELYACNGARFLANTTDSNSLNILMLDFSKLGTLYHCKLSQCRQELVIKAGDKVWIYDDAQHVSATTLDPIVEYWQACEFSLKFRLPLGFPVGIPMLSLAGRLFMQGLDDLRTYTEGAYTVVEFHIASGVLENIVASNLQHQNLFYKKSEIFRTVLSYVFGNIFVDQAYEYDQGTDEWKAIQFYMDQVIPFVTMIVPVTEKDYGIDQVTPMTVMKLGKLIFPKESRGLLMNRATREFIDYTRIPYKDQTLVTFSPQHPLYIEKRDGACLNGDVYYTDPTSLSNLLMYAPDDMSVDYHLISHTYLLTSRSHNTMVAYSQARPYTTAGSTTVTYTWANIIAGLTIEEATPHYNAAAKSWYLVKDGIAYAESEPYTFPSYTSFITWCKVSDPTEITLSAALTWIQDHCFRAASITEYNVDKKRFEVYDTGNNLLMYSEEASSSATPSSLDWTNVKTGDESTYASTLTAVRSAMNGKFIKEYDPSTDTLTLKDYSTGTPWVKAPNCLGVVYAALSWYKLLPYTNANITWTGVVEGSNVITDGIRCDRMAWQFNPAVFKSGYEQYLPGELIKDHMNYVLVDISIYKENDASSDLLDPDVNPDTRPDPILDNPSDYVLTADHEKVASKICIGTGTAPRPLTQLKISPTIVDGAISTTTIRTANAVNIAASYAFYDGNYLQTDPSSIGTSRIWKNNNSPSVTICYTSDATHPENSHWSIMNNGVEIFATDYAQPGSAPYNTELIWRLV